MAKPWREMSDAEKVAELATRKERGESLEAMGKRLGIGRTAIHEYHARMVQKRPQALQFNASEMHARQLSDLPPHIQDAYRRRTRAFLAALVREHRDMAIDVLRAGKRRHARSAKPALPLLPASNSSPPFTPAAPRNGTSQGADDTSGEALNMLRANAAEGNVAQIGASAALSSGWYADIVWTVGEMPVIPVVRGHGRQIIDEVCLAHGIDRRALRGRSRVKHVVLARHEAMYRMAVETALSTPHIGRLLGGRDHTTVIHGIRAHCARNGLVLPRGMDFGSFIRPSLATPPGGATGGGLASAKSPRFS